VDGVAYITFDQDAASLCFQQFSSRGKHMPLTRTSNLPFASRGDLSGDRTSRTGVCLGSRNWKTTKNSATRLWLTPPDTCQRAHLASSQQRSPRP
jgi:hypothetical protein